MSIREIIENTEIIKVINQIDIEINNFSKDTRKISNNDIFVGIKGENFDGNDFYKDALEKGAVCCILDKFKETDEIKEYLVKNNKCIILVNDTIKALGDLAVYKRNSIDYPIVAITGSAGKTSTKDMIYSVLSQKYKTLKTMGNYNNHIGLPLTLLSLKDEECLVLEMGMNHEGEIRYLTKIARPDVAVITNVGTAHIGFLGSRENILKAKLEIIEGLNESGTLIINNDNDLLSMWHKKNNEVCNCLTFGIKENSVVFPKDIEINDTYSEFTYEGERIKVPVGGEHFIYNALAALSVAKIFNIDTKLAKKGIENFELSSNRMSIIDNDGIKVINDSYNANFDAVKYAIKYLGAQNGRSIAVLGTMRELGDYSLKLHTDLGDVIKSENIDILITVGEYTDLINKRAEELGFAKENSYHIENNKEAIDLVNNIKTKGDNILIKASLSCNFKEVVEGVTTK